MTLSNTAILCITLVILTSLIGVTVADGIKTPVKVNSSEPVKTIAADNNTSDNSHSNETASTISWIDKTTVSGKIKNFLKDFKYQSGITF